MNIKKAWKTFKICKTLFMARNFGEYIHGGYNGSFEFCSYRYKGAVYLIPLSPVDED